MIGLLLCWICFIIRSNMGLYVSVCVSFICSFCVLGICMWKRSDVFSKEPFFSMWSMSIVFSIISYVC
jgi:hypothetical protein